MIIQTPSDLATYLISLATQHPAVRHVVYGEHSRSESDTLAASRYPQVEIDTPAAHIPVDQSQTQLITRIYVVTLPESDLNADEDISHDITFDIARDLINLVIRHTTSGYIDIEIDTTAPIQITPVAAMGSDQQRGWMFQIRFLVDSHSCTDELDIAALFIPQFSWQISDGVLSVEDLTHGSTLPGLTMTWYKQDASETAAVEMDESGQIDVSGMDPTQISVRIWLKAQYGVYTLWAYAHATPGVTSGRSTSFVPYHPQ